MSGLRLSELSWYILSFLKLPGLSRHVWSGPVAVWASLSGLSLRNLNWNVWSDLKCLVCNCASPVWAWMSARTWLCLKMICLVWNCLVWAWMSRLWLSGLGLDIRLGWAD